MKKIQKIPFNSDSQVSINIISKRESVLQYLTKKTKLIIWLV